MNIFRRKMFQNKIIVSMILFLFNFFFLEILLLSVKYYFSICESRLSLLFEFQTSFQLYEHQLQ